MISATIQFKFRVVPYESYFCVGVVLIKLYNGTYISAENIY